jgi:hypothetical protein
MQRKLAALAATIMVMLCLSTAVAKPPPAAKILETFAAEGFQYQIAMEPCRKGKCPITVNLLKDGKLTDKKPLPQTAADRKFTHQLADPAWFSAPYNAAPQLRVWESGEENTYVGVQAQAVPLDATHTGLLVTQLTGFERIRRDHALYSVAQGKLEKLWSFSGIGPTASTVYPVVRQDKNYLLFQKSRAGHSSEDGQGYSPDGDILPYSYEASLLHWQADRMAVETIPLPARGIPLYLAVIGFYPDMARAEQVAWETECQTRGEPDGASAVNLRAFTYMLAVADYPQLARREKILLGNIFFTRAEAENFQQGLKTCKPALNAEIIQIK